jgi:glycerophosphoryl diester phosphodiesterase
MNGGLSISLAGHVTRLKWHRLRRSQEDPEFGSAAMSEGFRLGASMELDLRVCADGGFVVIHDETLDRETTATGILAKLKQNDLDFVNYQQSESPLILSEHLASLMPSAHPNALLQFDMKDDLAAIGQTGLDHLEKYFGEITAPIIFSGGCADLISELSRRLPHVPCGIDPTDRLDLISEAQGIRATEEALLAELRSSSAPDTCYLHWELILQAREQGLDMVALCHAEGVKVDAWTYTLADPSKGFSDQEWAQFQALMAMNPDQITTDEAVATETAWESRLKGRSENG